MPHRNPRLAGRGSQESSALLTIGSVSQRPILSRLQMCCARGCLSRMDGYQVGAWQHAWGCSFSTRSTPFAALQCIRDKRTALPNLSDSSASCPCMHGAHQSASCLPPTCCRVNAMHILNSAFWIHRRADLGSLLPRLSDRMRASRTAEDLGVPCESSIIIDTNACGGPRLELAACPGAIPSVSTSLPRLSGRRLHQLLTPLAAAGKEAGSGRGRVFPQGLCIISPPNCCYPTCSQVHVPVRL